MSRRYRTVDVFTQTRFGGNPLAVVLDADGLSDAQMQAIAKEFGYSETTFVCRAADPRNTAQVRIFTPELELPFAGHPNVGTAYVLASLDAAAAADAFVFEEKAGLVRVGLKRVGGAVVAAQLTAPQPLSLGATFDSTVVAACLGLAASDIAVTRHAPVVASVGLPFVVAEIGSRAALRRAKADAAAFAKILPLDGADAIYFYTREISAEDGAVDFTARMFGLPEDPATGSATCAAAALIASLGAPRDGTRTFAFAQGVDMGRPSRLDAEVDLADGGVRAARVGGACVPVMRGILEI